MVFSGRVAGYADCFCNCSMPRSTRWTSLFAVAVALAGCSDDPVDQTTAGSMDNGGVTTVDPSAGSGGPSPSASTGGGSDGEATSEPSGSAGSGESSTESSSDATTGGPSSGTDGSSGDESSGSDSGDPSSPVCDVDVTCTGDTVWSRQFGNSSNTSSNEYISGVATDDAGFSYIGGAVAGTADFGMHGVIEGPAAAFVAKVDSEGEVVWVRELHADTGLEVDAVDIDAMGNATVAGSIRGDLDAGSGPVSGDGSNWDVYVASFDSTGELRFADVYGSSGDMDTLSDVAVHPDGNIAITGRFSDSMNFGGNQLHATSNSDDVYVAVFDQGGGHVWSQRYGDESSQLGDGITFDGEANVIVAARNYSTIDFGGMPHTTDGTWAIAVAKLAADDGERIWSRQFQNTEGVWVGLPRIEADADGIYLGTYSSSANLNRIDWGMGSQEGYFFVVKFDQAGNTEWSRPFASLRGAQALEPDGGGSVLVVGDLQGTADFGGTTLTSYENSYDAFIAKYDAANGDMHWARAVGDYNQQSNIQRGLGVGVDAAGYVYVGGSFYGVVNFDDGQLTASSGFGGSDGYLARLEP